MAEQSMILVTGSTGNVGRHVVSQLLDEGAAVRALARNPDSADLPEGVEVVRGDLSVPDSLEAGLDGVEAVFLVWPFGTAEAAPAVLDAVTKHARRIVYLSSMGIRDDLEQQADPINGFHADLEHVIERSGLEWTFLRPSGFATNTLGWARQIRAGGVVHGPFGALSRPLIHERDIAAVAVRALTGDGHGGKKHLLTGPQAMTQIEQAHTIGEAIGRPVRYEEISPEAARKQMLTDGWPPSFANGALKGWATMLTEPEPVLSTVEELTRAPAHTFREWATDHADDFR
jgi:uncharacterized protein YbjT (DUF2867 family)